MIEMIQMAKSVGKTRVDSLLQEMLLGGMVGPTTYHYQEDSTNTAAGNSATGGNANGYGTWNGYYHDAYDLEELTFPIHANCTAFMLHRRSLQ